MAIDTIASMLTLENWPYADLGNRELRSQSTSTSPRRNDFTAVNRCYIRNTTPPSTADHLQRHRDKDQDWHETDHDCQILAVLKAATQPHEHSSHQFNLSPRLEHREDISSVYDLEDVHRGKRPRYSEPSRSSQQIRQLKKGPGRQYLLDFKVVRSALRSTTGLLSPPPSGKAASVKCFPTICDATSAAENRENTPVTPLSSPTRNSSRDASVASPPPIIAPKNFREACDIFEKQHKLSYSDPKCWKRLRSPSPSDDEDETFGMRIQSPYDHELDDECDTRHTHATKSYLKMPNIAYVKEDEGEGLLEVVESEEHHGRYGLTRPYFMLPMSDGI